MKKIVIDENGNPIDELAERNDAIKLALAEILEEFIKEKDSNRAFKVKEKLGYRFAKQLYLELAKYPPMSVEQFVNLDYDDLNDYWVHYLMLTAYYNRFFEIVDNKQLFCAYTGLNTRQYSQLEQSADEDIRNLMISINGAFLGLGFVAGESGNADVKAVNTRLRANGEAGHGVISASEDKLIEQVSENSMIEMERELAKIISSNTKMLNKG
jgi:hypothetical protein